MIIRRYLSWIDPKMKGRVSWSQCGEDLAIAQIFSMAGIERPSYLDIGAHHAAFLSNTYYFYRKGSRGVLVEPDPDLARELKAMRKRDTVLQVGIGGGKQREAVFYQMSTPTLNTFSREDAEGYEAGRAFLGDQRIRARIKVPLRSVNEILAEHLPQGVDLLSVDVEGLDLAVIKSLDLRKHRPGVICVESLRFDDKGRLQKVKAFGPLLRKGGYEHLADTYINSIFVRRGLLGAGLAKAGV